MAKYISEVLVEAPASSANLGPGFDVLALALKEPADRLQINRDDSKRGFFLQVKSRWTIPTNPMTNAAGAVARKVARDYSIRSRIRMKLEKRVPIGVGLGSSAASSVCAALGMSVCFNLKLTTSEILKYASDGEEVASGVGHFDNVSASLLGGVVVVRNLGGIEVSRIETAPLMRLGIAMPELDLPARKTEFARSLLPARVRIEDMTRNVSMAASLILGLSSGDVGLVGKGMHDFVVEPARSKMIPGYEAVRRAALEAGASGVCISGAGPSLLAVYHRKKASGSKILRAMVSAFVGAGVQAGGFETGVGGGARIVRTK